MHLTVASLLPRTTLRHLHQEKARMVASHLPTTVDRLHQQRMHRTVASLLPCTTLRRLHQEKARRVASHLPTSTVEHLRIGTLPPYPYPPAPAPAVPAQVLIRINY